MVPAIDETNTPAPPGAMTSPKASSMRAVPTRSTRRMAATGAWTGESPAVWTTATTGPRSAASAASTPTESARETSRACPTTS
jgi:hypothetical protein